MKQIILFSLTAALFSLNPNAYANSEEFKIETSGKLHCSDFNVRKFNAKNNLDLWIRIVNDTDVLLSESSNFPMESTFLLKGTRFLTNKKKAKYVGTSTLASGAFISIESDLSVNSDSSISKVKGRYIQDNLFTLGCFTTGKFKSSKPLN